MTKEQREALLRIPFYCPKCGEETTAILESGVLMAIPWEGTVRCENCGQLWEVQLEEVKDEAEGHS